MTRYKIVYSQEAFGDLSVIYHYIALQSLDLKIAGRFIKTLKMQLSHLEFSRLATKELTCLFAGQLMSGNL